MDVALVMAVDIEEVDGAKDPEAWGTQTLLFSGSTGSVGGQRQASGLRLFQDLREHQGIPYDGTMQGSQISPLGGPGNSLDPNIYTKTC